MNQKVVRGIRGAINVTENSIEAISEATATLLQEAIRENELVPEDIASIFFTVTPDINAQFPARIARQIGLDWVPLMCSTEIDVPGSMPKVIRILLHVNTYKGQHEVKHVYLREAVKLRPDLS